MMKRYSPKDIESKWQKIWEEQKIYYATEDPDKPKRYVLEYFPYPSGAAMHVGHVRNYTIGDAMSRFYRMNGYNVMHPMGWDSFGLPAENYAIKHNISPKQAIAENTSKFKQQLSQMGFSYDWSREIDSSDPNYYKWTQWFFKLLLERGLAYQKDSLQWWCETDKTVLANEQVEAGKCWRCGNEVTKKPLKQWFFKITDYADRLVADLDDLDWSEGIKAMQRNWIGKSSGAEITFYDVDDDDARSPINVFTTRPDTLYGATFLVLAPEHSLVDTLTRIDQKEAVQKYIASTQSKSEVERQDTDREKTGVFTGAYALNPLTAEYMPIWIADYVLAGYGTGAIMAVPAHDERDYEFAQKFALPITQVIAKDYVDTQNNPPHEGAEYQERDVVQCFVKHPTEEKVLLLDVSAWAKSHGYVTGGIEAGESAEEAARREVVEETGYTDIKDVTSLCDDYFATFYHGEKKVNVKARLINMLVTLGSLDQTAVAQEEIDKHAASWIDIHDASKYLKNEGVLYVLDQYRNGRSNTYEGTLINSGDFSGQSSAEARESITRFIAQEGYGQEQINYKIRDWLISRQRYWGAPIPVIHCDKDGVVPVPDDQLPVELPEVKSYQPTGEGTSVLASVEDWVNVDCPKCGGPAKRETDTMDGFACSSWYFLRFADPHNDKEPFSKERAQFWLPVDDYIGGAEHAVMHLLYARMWTKVMNDAGLIDFNEPFKSLRNQGMIQAPDGRKMSKSWGNVISPNELIDQGYGADSIRIMELFIGPWDQKANWSVEGMGGAFRFLQRSWTLVQEYLETEQTNGAENPELLRLSHAVTKKVTEDLKSMGFNTAIASMMEYVNDLYRAKAKDGFDSQTWRTAIERLLLVLAPFAPHITDELWQQLGNTSSIHVVDWPAFDEALLVQDTITVVVQVNGKVRAQLAVAADSSKEDILAVAKADAHVQTFTSGNTITKEIYVPGKLVNLVVS